MGSDMHKNNLHVTPLIWFIGQFHFFVNSSLHSDSPLNKNNWREGDKKPSNTIERPVFLQCTYVYMHNVKKFLTRHRKADFSKKQTTETENFVDKLSGDNFPSPFLVNGPLLFFSVASPSCNNELYLALVNQWMLCCLKQLQSQINHGQWTIIN